MTHTALRPRSATEIVDAAFQILRAHYSQFVVCSAIAYIPLLILRLVVVGDPRRLLGSGGAVDIEASGAFFRATLIDLAGSWLTFTLMLSVILVCVSQAYLGEPVDVAAAVRRAVVRLPRVMIAALLTYIWMILFFFALFIPILWVVARNFAVTQAIILEDASIPAAFGRSGALSKGRKRHILNTLGLVALIYWILVIGASAIASLAGSFVVQTLISSLVIVLVYPVMAITEGLLYYDARIQSEGLDIELMAQELGGSLPAEQVAH